MEAMNDWLDKQCRRCLVSDRELWRQWSSSLPQRTQNEPWGCDAHSIQAIRAAMSLVRPTRVLEIGFNLGASAMMWLQLGVQRLVSLDIRQTDSMLAAASAISARFGDAFTFMPRTEALEFNEPFDLIFIDGGHEHGDVILDLDLGMKLGIPYYLLDDWLPRYGPGVQSAVRERDMIPLAVFGNMALCVPPAGYS